MGDLTRSSLCLTSSNVYIADTVWRCILFMWFSRNFGYLILQNIRFTRSPFPLNTDVNACLSVDCWFDLNGSKVVVLFVYLVSCVFIQVTPHEEAFRLWNKVRYAVLKYLCRLRKHKTQRKFLKSSRGSADRLKSLRYEVLFLPWTRVINFVETWKKYGGRILPTVSKIRNWKEKTWVFRSMAEPSVY